MCHRQTSNVRTDWRAVWGWRACAIVLAGATITRAAGPDQIAPRSLTVQSTIHCIGINWHIEGDANRNCRVDVSFRPQGTSRWRAAMPLVRVEHGTHDGRAMDDEVIPASWRGKRFWDFDPPIAFGNRLTGSIFGLAADTSYEVRLALADADGGSDERQVEVRTRAEPRPNPSGRRWHVKPNTRGGDGSAQHPFGTVERAEEVAAPGDTIILAPGRYAAVKISKSGQPGLPIRWQGDPDGRTVFTGRLAVDARHTRYVWLDSISIEAEQTAIRADSAEGLVVQYCQIRAPFGVMAVAASDAGAARNFYVADNTFDGPATWDDPKGPQLKYEAVNLSGDGHVVCHNRVTGYCDAISIGGHRLATHDVDVYRNDIHIAVDDGIECDYVSHNIRVFENRLTNSFSGLSNQPCFGGPCYWIRNALFAVDHGFKFACNSSGIVAIHNTVVAGGIAWHNLDARHMWLRNNVFVGGSLDTGKPWNALHNLHGIALDWDHDAIQRRTSRLLELRTRSRTEALGEINYRDMPHLFADTGLEQHGMEITLDDLAAVSVLPDARRTYVPDQWDVTPAGDGALVDAGAVIPNINDDFVGNAPDVGAVERGTAPIHYGPRPRRSATGP